MYNHNYYLAYIHKVHDLLVRTVFSIKFDLYATNYVYFLNEVDIYTNFKLCFLQEKFYEQFFIYLALD